MDPRKPGPHIFDDVLFNYEPYYVGKGISGRIFDHLRKKYQNQDRNRHKVNRINLIRKSYDIKKFILKLKVGLFEREAFQLEKELILKIGRLDLSTGPLLNCNEGGSGADNSKYRSYQPLTIEQKNHLRQKLTGRTFTQEHRRNKSIAQMGPKNHRFGKATSSEIKIRISESLKGRVFSSETLAKIRNGRLGKQHSLEARKKISLNHTDFSGHKNPNIKKYQVISPDGDVFIVLGGLPEFAKKKNINAQILYNASSTNKPRHGWLVKKLETL